MTGPYEDNRNKLAIGNSYIDKNKSDHGWKKIPDSRSAIIIGAAENNIGRAIGETLIGENFSVDEYDRIGGWEAPANIDEILEGAQDTLILCQGHTHLDWIEDQPPVEIENMINDNLTSPIICCSKFIQKTIHLNNKKTIIIIGSMGGKAVLNGSSPYCASKAGIIHFVKCIGWELAPKGYDVFVINPSNVEGAPMSEKTITDLMRYKNLNRQEAEDYWAAVLPRNEWLQKSDIGNIVKFLVSGDAAYMSGTCIDLTGGQR